MDRNWLKSCCIYFSSGRDKWTFMQEKMRQFLSPKAVIKVISPPTHSEHHPFISPLSLWAVHWPTKGFFQHVFRSVALFKQSPAGVAWQRTFSDGPWQWWNTSAEVQELQLKHTVARVLTESMCVSACLRGSESSDEQRPIWCPTFWVPGDVYFLYDLPLITFKGVLSKSLLSVLPCT